MTQVPKLTPFNHIPKPTIRLCFIGLASFAVEFGIVFMAFSSFFFYMLRTHLENFRDITRTVMNVIAMSIGKFNFGAIKDANMLAAVIFFVFSIVVNMVLINMMMAIINMSFEEVKVDKHKFKSKFQLFDYIKRSARELYGSTYAKPIVVKYGKNDGSSSDHEVSRLRYE